MKIFKVVGRCVTAPFSRGSGNRFTMATEQGEQYIVQTKGKAAQMIQKNLKKGAGVYVDGVESDRVVTAKEVMFIQSL